MEKVSLAIIGATGIVGQEILALLAEEDFEGGRLQLAGSDDSVGELYDFKGKEIQIISSENLQLDQPTLTILCSPKDVSQKLLAPLKASSLAVIDCSGLDAKEHGLTLMPDAISDRSKGVGFSARTPCGFIAGSFLSTIAAGRKINSIVVNSIEPVSGAGRAGLDELWNQTQSIFNQTPADPEFFPEQIAYNILPQVDVVRPDGATAYEQRIVDDLAARLDCDEITATSVRVPIMYGCGVTLTFKMASRISAEDIYALIGKSPRFVVDQEAENPPSTLSVIGDDRIHLGRLRVWDRKEGSLVACWLVADNIKACIARPIVDLYRSLMPSM